MDHELREEVVAAICAGTPPGFGITDAEWAAARRRFAEASETVVLIVMNPDNTASAAATLGATADEIVEVRRRLQVIIDEKRAGIEWVTAVMAEMAAPALIAGAERMLREEGGA